MAKTRLLDVCNPKQWKTIPASELLDEGYPVYGANGIIGYYNKYNHEMPVVTITCRGATCGSINITTPKAYITGNSMCLDDLRNDIELEYIYYCLCHYDFNNVISGSAQPQITRVGLEKVFITILSHDEQIQIISKLKKIENIINFRKKELEYLDTFIKARFVELFGDPVTNPYKWDETTVGNECFYIKDGPHKSLPDMGKENGGHPFISVRNIVNHTIDFSTAKYISDEDYANAIKKCHPEKGDMLYSKGGTTGIAKLIDVDIEFANWVHVAVLKFHKDKLNGIFFENMLNCDYCYGQSQRLTKGIANRDLVLSAMAQIKMYRPPIELQNQFADFVKQVDKSKVVYQIIINKLTFLQKICYNNHKEQYHIPG